jgi:tRNA threonylcarbamoyladenosine biosynthesis protein TsaB
MRLLAVDTTTPSGSVALLEDDRIIGEFCNESPATHSSRLLGAADALLRSFGLTIADVDAFAVAAGPGSFTGIRIGLSLVKSLAFASGKPVAPVSSLRALALKLARPKAGLAAAILDAKKGEVYAALFEAADLELTEIVPQGAYRPGDFVARLPDDRTVSFIGGGIPLCRDLLVSRLGERAVFPHRSLFIAAEVGLLGARELQKSRGITAGGLEPLYFRRSQAEEKH